MTPTQPPTTAQGRMTAFIDRQDTEVLIESLLKMEVARDPLTDAERIARQALISAIEERIGIAFGDGDAALHDRLDGAFTAAETKGTTVVYGRMLANLWADAKTARAARPHRAGQHHGRIAPPRGT